MDAKHIPEPPTGSKRALSPRLPPAKRAKALQACLSCRRYKTRCEILDGDIGAQCHRCRVLNMPCSFEDASGSSSRAPSQAASTHKPDCRTSLPSSSKMPGGPDDSFSPEKSISKTRDGCTLDAPSAFNRVQPVEKAEDILRPERLLRPWGISKLPGGFESHAVPMLAMQTMIRSGVNGEQVLKDKVDQSLLQILGPERLKWLTHVFEERYTPWMCLQPNYHSDSPLVQLAQCCVASRHLDSSTRAIATPQLYCLADDVLLKQAFGPSPSTDAIYATLIHSLWGPVGDPSSRRESRDGRLLASTAVSMAMNSRLSQATTYALTLRNKIKPNESSSAELTEALDTARLWFALNSTETMLCYGTGRDPISDCNKLVLDSIATTSTTSISSARDMRLSLINQLLAVTGDGLRLRLRSQAEVCMFYSDVIKHLDRMDFIERMIAPFSVLAEHEVFHFAVLRIYYQTFRFLVLLHAIMELKSQYVDESELPWYELVEFNGIKPAASWGSQALVLAEGILTTLLSLSELELLSAAPDSFFAMVGLATLFVIIYKWSVLEQRKELLPGLSDSLLARTVELLSLISCSPDHSAARCTRVIEEGITSFRRKLASCGPQETSRQVYQQQSAVPAHSCAEVHSHRPEEPSSMLAGGEYGDDRSPETMAQPSHAVDLQHTLLSVPTSEQSYFSSQVFFDDEFWTSFMATLSEEGLSHMARSV